MIKKHYLKTLLFSLSILTFSTGCVSPQLSPINAHTLKGDFKAAAIAADKGKNLKSKLDESNQLPTLYAGNSYLYSKDYKTSLKRLDEAEKIIKFHNEEILLGSTGDLIAQLLLNDSMIDYHASITESIMVNTYKAIDYMALGDMKNARIEFNRAIDRQRRAKETYAKIVSKIRKAIKEKEKKVSKENKENKKDKKTKSQMLPMDIAKTSNDSNFKNMLDKRYPMLKSYKVYPDFINPFTNYLAGIFFATQKDYTKSADILKEVYGMLPNNKIAKNDFMMVEKILDGKKSKNLNYVWVIYANGLSPKKEQFKINAPLFIVTNKISYTGIALPKMKLQQLATKDLSLYHNHKLLGTTKRLASMDRVVLTEFKYSYNDIVTRAIFSALLKTYVQYEVGKRAGEYASLAAGFLQSYLTKADTRIWKNLPKEYQVLKVKMPKSKNLTLNIGSKKIDLDLRDAKNAIIFVRKPTLTSQVSYSVIKL